MKRSAFRLSLVAIAAAGVASGACSKNTTDGPVEPTAVAATEEGGTAAEDTEDAKKADAEKAEAEKRVADAIAKLHEELSMERERWTDALVAEAKALVQKKFKSPKAAISAAIAGSHRKPGNSERDLYRHPLETLEFFGLTPSSRVVEMGVGGGWYTEIIAPVVANKGSYTGGTYDAEGPRDSMRTVYGMRQAGFFGNSSDLYGKAKTFDYGAERVVIGEPGSADLVLAIREMHNWHRRGAVDSMLEAIANVLAAGGTFGIVQHRAADGANADESANKGRLPEAWLIEKVESKGFKLVGKSDINANPKDTKDYEKGVWTLPPAFAMGDTDKEKYAAIGESDRMTLKFERISSN